MKTWLWVIVGLVLASASLLGVRLAKAGSSRGSGVPAGAPAVVVRLHAHFDAAGLATEVAQVRTTKTGQRSVSVFTLRSSQGKEPRTFLVEEWSDSVGAQSRVEQVLQMPTPSHPQANGNLVLLRTGWPAEDAETRTVGTAFGAFPAKPGH